MNQYNLQFNVPFLLYKSGQIMLERTYTFFSANKTILISILIFADQKVAKHKLF